MEQLFNYNIVIDVVGMGIVFVIMLSGLRARHKDAYDKFVFAMSLSVLLVLITDIIAWALDGKTFTGARELLYIVNSVFYAMQVVFSYTWALFTLFWNFRSETMLKKYALPLSVPMVLELIMIVINPITGWVFTIDVINVYTRGSQYYLNLIPYIVYIVLAIIVSAYMSIFSKDAQQKRQSLMLLVYMVLPLSSTVLDSLYYGVSCLWPCTALLIMMIYVSNQQRALMEEQLKRTQEAQRSMTLEKELAQSRMAVMLSQIQPHFLYNSLTAIKALCHIQPELAEQAIVEFSDYLRGNMDSLVSDSPIAFSKELEHTRRYLMLEKLRFQDRLNIDYNINTTLFCLPALSLQLIVENAVRHGITKRTEGGTVRVSTREMDCAFIVQVSDDGVGFESLSQNDGRAHLGLKNVSDRLESMQGGRLEIESEKGRGTTVTLIIPKGENK